VSEVFIPLTAFSKKNKGYAFVEFETSTGAEKALAATGQIRIADRTIYVQPAKPKAPQLFPKMKTNEGDVRCR